MTKNKGLGRGLEALFHDDDLMGGKEVPRQEYIRQLSLSLIDTNKDQPRKNFRDEPLQELAASIAANGLIQPITVQQKGDRFEIVAGERRFRACRLLGLDAIPAIVKELSPRQVVELSLIENLQREDLNPIEEAAAIESLMQEYALTQQELSDQLGRSRPAIANSLRLLQLPASIKTCIIGGQLSAGHGRALAALEKPAQQEQLAQAAIAAGWSVREMETRIKLLQQSKPVKKSLTRDVAFDDAESTLRDYFGTKVKIQGSAKKGKIEIEYYSQDDLERILQLVQS